MDLLRLFCQTIARHTIGKRRSSLLGRALANIHHGSPLPRLDLHGPFKSFAPLYLRPLTHSLALALWGHLGSVVLPLQSVGYGGRYVSSQVARVARRRAHRELAPGIPSSETS